MQPKPWKRATLALAGGLLLTGAVFANDAMAKSPDAEFAAMDTNRDGKVSPDEHAAGAKRMFDIMDANHDGKVTADEMSAAHRSVTGTKPMAGEMSASEKIQKLDTDGDGVLTAAEHATGAASMFQKMDTDHDGSLSKAELAAGQAMKMRSHPSR